MLRPALLAIRGLGLKLSGWHLLAATGDSTVSLQQLEELQKSRRQQFASDLKRVWSAVIIEVLRPLGFRLAGQSFIDQLPGGLALGPEVRVYA